MTELLGEAWRLLEAAECALWKMRLDGAGSDISLSHEVRMFALDFSPEGSTGPGALQITGSGRLDKWRAGVRAALAAAKEGTNAR